MSKSKRPNILFIMSDDHAAHALSCYGSRVNKTPNLDRIANEGIRFDNCFCTNSICEPSRAAILTGTYNHINGVTTIGAHLDNSLPNIAKELKAVGYQTAIFGKWHLGQGLEHWPTGFEEWNILQGQGPYFNPEMVRNGEKIQYEGYSTDIITDLTIEYLKNRDPEKPFFINCHHKAPHRSWEPDEKHKHMYEDETLPLPVTLFDNYENRSNAAREAKMRITTDMTYFDLKLVPPEGESGGAKIPYPDSLDGFSLTPSESGKAVTFGSHEELVEFKYQRYIKDYLRCIASVDDNVGRLLDELEAEGVLDDTVVIYTSDQGFFLGDHGWFDKRFMYEESLRMPFIVRYPKEIKAGSVCEDIMTNVDIPATFADWAGVETADYLQGYSFRPLLSGKAPEGWQESMYYRYWMHLSHHYVSAHYGIRTKDFKLIYYYGEAMGQPNTVDESKQPEWELFDLRNDPHEMKNVYNDPGYRDTVSALKKELHALQAKVGDKPVEEID
ncbi:MAG: sulfatase [Planctomycetes bacterium]|nr:sulfatase [Planctomycetota bacterium]